MSKYTKWIVLGVLVLVVFWGVSARNGFITMEEGIDASWAQVENQLKRRYDLIPNLVNTVKGITKQENEVFGRIADARARLAGAKTPSETISASGQLETALSRLLVIAENYPQLRSSDSFNRLMDELAGTENRISVERRRYNTAVQAYNRSVRLFPKSIIASWLHLEKKPYFEIEARESETPNVQF